MNSNIKKRALMNSNIKKRVITNSNIKNIAVSVTIFSFLAVMGIWIILRTPDRYSESERRLLASKPALELENITDGKYMKELAARQILWS